MRYMLAILLPPLGILCCGRPFLAFFNIFLCLFGYIPGQMHALFVTHDYLAEKRTARIIGRGFALPA